MFHFLQKLLFYYHYFIDNQYIKIQLKKYFTVINCVKIDVIIDKNEKNNEK